MAPDASIWNDARVFVIVPCVCTSMLTSHNSQVNVVGGWWTCCCRCDSSYLTSAVQTAFIRRNSGQRCSVSINPLCVLLCVGWMLTSLCPMCPLISSLSRFYFERARTGVPDRLDLSLCTVGTSSAFLQTADNICLLTCTVTRRTLLTLQMTPDDPTWPHLDPPPLQTTELPWTLEHKPGPFTSGCQ